MLNTHPRTPRVSRGVPHVARGRVRPQRGCIDRHRVENLGLQDPATSEELPIEVVSSQITDQRGQLTAIVSILHDLTAVVENERPRARAPGAERGAGGVKQEDTEAIFDDFRRVDQSSTRKYGGTGLGLSITRKMSRRCR